jgi:hypothetical protein
MRRQDGRYDLVIFSHDLNLPANLIKARAKSTKKTGLVSQGMTEKPGEFSN